MVHIEGKSVKIQIASTALNAHASWTNYEVELAILNLPVKASLMHFH